MNPWHIDPLDLTMRLLIALVLGGLIGFERERNNHPAGFRTHILVCLGSTLIMLLSAYGFGAFANEPNVRLDPARLAAQVISGIGFLGAGTILRNGLAVSGLTTAASLWVAAAIGLSVGAGFYYGAILATAIALISLWILNIAEKKFFHDKRMFTLKISTAHRHGILSQISSILDRSGISVRQLIIDEEATEAGDRMDIHFTIKVPKPHAVIVVSEEIGQLAGVTSLSAEPA